jgi:hypothetical protein
MCTFVYAIVALFAPPRKRLGHCSPWYALVFRGCDPLLERDPQEQRGDGYRGGTNSHGREGKSRGSATGIFRPRGYFRLDAFVDVTALRFPR